MNVAFNLSSRVRTGSGISEYERQAGIAIIDIAIIGKVIEKAPDLLQEIDEMPPTVSTSSNSDISLELSEKAKVFSQIHFQPEVL